ncbi:MAG TPA: hypothetical protein PLE61_15975 [Vicinamibacterales bacterium]|nr:hypothetical protein [Vicinamibacterales bacterium]
MSEIPYRPITDTWILARAKRAGGDYYYGRYPGGFLERARALLGVSMADSVLHVCGGMVRRYPYRRGFGPNDKTLDLDPALEPDFCQDARDPYPLQGSSSAYRVLNDGRKGWCWRAVLADPPYSQEDAEKYVPGPSVLPTPGVILKNALAVVRPGGRVGILHYYAPQPPRGSNAVLVAMVSVVVGFNNHVRLFTVYENTEGTNG